VGTPHLYRRLLAAILLLLAGCRSTIAPPDTRGADIKTIREGEILWIRHWSIRDVNRIIAHYSEDAAWMGPHFPFADGREAIREIVQRLIEDGNLSITFESTRVDTSRSGELAYSQGAYTLTLTDPISKQRVTDSGNYMRLYRKEPTGWRCFQEIISAAPTAGPVIQ
jgi:ketosteroid isomerase-like protein